MSAVAIVVAVAWVAVFVDFCLFVLLKKADTWFLVSDVWPILQDKLGLCTKN